MPWTCCDAELLDDVNECPACGGSKQSWTVRYRATRVFSLPVGGWIDLELVDAHGAPIGGERYVVEVQDGTTREGTLDPVGYARVKTPRKQGTCTVCFPDLDASEWDWDVEVTEAAAASGAPEEAPPAPALTHVELEVVGPDGRPVGGLRYELELPDGARREGVLGRDGRAREDAVPHGTCKVSLPELDGCEWELQASSSSCGENTARPSTAPASEPAPAPAPAPAAPANMPTG